MAFDTLALINSIKAHITSEVVEVKEGQEPATGSENGTSHAVSSLKSEKPSEVPSTSFNDATTAHFSAGYQSLGSLRSCALPSLLTESSDIIRKEPVENDVPNSSSLEVHKRDSQQTGNSSPVCLPGATADAPLSGSSATAPPTTFKMSNSQRRALRRKRREEELRGRPVPVTYDDDILSTTEPGNAISEPVKPVLGPGKPVFPQTTTPVVARHPKPAENKQKDRSRKRKMSANRNKQQQQKSSWEFVRDESDQQQYRREHVWLPGAVRTLKDNMGKYCKSILNGKEQERFVAQLLNFQSKGTFKYSDNAPWFKAIKEVVAEEQAQFNAVVKINAQSQYPKPYIHVNRFPHVNGYAANCMKSRLEALKLAAPYFVVRESVSLTKLLKDLPTNLCSLSGPPIFVEQVLLQHGKPTRYVLPDLHFRSRVADLNHIQKIYPPSCTKKRMSLISTDSNAQKLASKWSPHVVITPKCLKTLVSVLALGTEHFVDIPLKVKRLHNRHGAVINVLFFENPILSSEVTATGRLQRYMKYASKAIFQKIETKKPSKQPPFKRAKVGESQQHYLEPRSPDASSEEPEPDAMDQEAIRSSHVTNGHDAATSSKQQQPVIGSPATDHKVKDETIEHGDKSERKEESKTGGDGLVLDFLMGLQSKLHSEGLWRQSTSCEPTHSTASAAVKNSREPVEKAEEYVFEREGVCQSYTIWSLQELTLMLRSVVDGNWSDPSDNHKMSTVSVLPKIEYQHDYGGEVMTPAEALNAYLTALLKQIDLLLRVHVDAARGDIVAIEKKNVNDLYKGEVVKNANCGLLVLHNLLLDLMKQSLSEDEAYVLRFKPQGRSIELLEACSYSAKAFEEATTAEKINLNVFYQSLMQRKLNAEPVPPFEQLWLPIDPESVLQWHRVKKRAPCLFEPRPGEEPTPQLLAKLPKASRQFAERKLPRDKHSREKRKKQRTQAQQAAASAQPSDVELHQVGAGFGVSSNNAPRSPKQAFQQPKPSISFVPPSQRVYVNQLPFSQLP